MAILARRPDLPGGPRIHHHAQRPRDRAPGRHLAGLPLRGGAGRGAGPPSPPGRCRAAIRASYVDGLDGVVYTTGVLAFPDRARAAAFTRRLPSGRPPVAALRALALPGTASAQFTAAARQTATARQDGPYVLLTVAGYADGRPAAATGEFDAAAFSAAGQLAREILAPLNRPAVVNCARRQWSC